MTSLLDRSIHSLRAMIRRMITQHPHPAALARIWRIVLLVPVFGLMLALLHVRARLIGPMQVQATAAAGGRFLCHPPDLIQMYLWLFDVWEPDLTGFIERRLKPGDGFVDVGANIGYYSILAAGRIGPHGGATAVEASPAVFASLKETIALNQPANIRAVNKAAAEKPATIQVFAGPGHNTGLTTTVATRGLRAQADIESLPLDDLLSADEIRAARLVKIDVEGGEPAVLAGMPRFLQECRHDVELLIELSPNWWSDPALTPERVLDPFIKCGFHVYAMPNSYWPWRYLWPHRIAAPQRVRHALNQRVDRLDLVLSRIDADTL